MKTTKTNLMALRWACSFCLLLSSGTLLAQNSESTPSTTPAAGEVSPAEGLRMNFRNVPLEMVLDYMSEAAGFAIIAEVDVSGTVSVWNNNPLSKAEAVSLETHARGEGTAEATART